MSEKFEVPEEDRAPENTIMLTVIGIKEGSPKREILFESKDPYEFEKAYKYYYKLGKYTMVLKEFNNKAGGFNG